jgi:hypothetical protein
VLAPIVAEVRRDQRARRGTSPQGTFGARASRGAKLKKERTRLSVLLAVAVIGMVLAAAGGIVAGARRPQCRKRKSELPRNRQKAPERRPKAIYGSFKKSSGRQLKRIHNSRSLDGERRALGSSIRSKIALWQSLARDVA